MKQLSDFHKVLLSPYTYLFYGSIHQQAREERMEWYEALGGNEWASHRSRVYGDGDGASIGTWQHEALHHLPQAKWLPLIAGFYELWCILFQEETIFPLNTKINNVAMVFDTSHPARKNLQANTKPQYKRTNKQNHRSKVKSFKYNVVRGQRSDKAFLYTHNMYSAVDTCTSVCGQIYSNATSLLSVISDILKTYQLNCVVTLEEHAIT